MTLPLDQLAVMLQVRAPADTIVAHVVQEHGLLDQISGVLELVVLVMLAVLLGALVWLLLTLRKVLIKGQSAVDKLVGDVRPIVQHAEHMAGDVRATVSQLRSDVERVTGAANAISDQLLDAAAVTAQRVDEVNAVLDVVQRELEDLAISSVATVHGVRTGATELASALAGRRSGNGPREVPPKRRARPEIRDDMEERRSRRDQLRGDNPE